MRPGTAVRVVNLTVARGFVVVDRWVHNHAVTLSFSFCVRVSLWGSRQSTSSMEWHDFELWTGDLLLSTAACLN